MGMQERSTLVGRSFYLILSTFGGILQPYALGNSLSSEWLCLHQARRVANRFLSFIISIPPTKDDNKRRASEEIVKSQPEIFMIFFVLVS